MTHTYPLAGMHCQSCVSRVGAALRSVPGVTAAEVTLSPPQARVQMDQHVPAEALDHAVRSAGDYHLDAEGAAGLHAIDSPSTTPALAAAPKPSLYPLLLIVAYIAGAVALLALASGERSWHELMRQFMAGFFLVFSFFKLLDLRGFADAYQSYDVIAKQWRPWAFAYPFVELALGIAYLVNFQPTLTNLVTLVLMLIGSAGVLQALRAKRSIRCACLGTALNLPMTTVTLVEDLAMAAMALLALLPR